MGGNSSKPEGKPSLPKQDRNRNRENGGNTTRPNHVNPETIQRRGVKPLPPSTTRKEIFNKDLLREATKNANQQVPSKELGSYQSLAAHLTKGLKSDLERVWAFYLWVVNLDLNSQDLSKGGAKNTPKGDLKDVKSGKSNISDIFSTLCGNGNLKCVTIEGLTKDDNFEIGWTEKKLVKGKWNAVFIKEEWRLVQLEFGISTNPKWKSLYFFTDPEDLIHWCYPNEQEWQLLSTSITKHDFLSMPNCTRKCFEMGVKVVQPTLGKLKVDQGRISVEVLIDKMHSHNTVLNYRLSCKKVKNGSLEPDTPRSTGDTTVRRDEQLTQGSSIEQNENRNIDYMSKPETEQNDSSNSQSTPDLRKYVFMSRADSRVVFDVDFPVPGTYVLDIEGRTFSEKGGHNIVSVICQFKFSCNKCSLQDKRFPLPDAPEIGWGPTPHCMRYGVRPASHGYGHIYILPKETLKIRFEYTGKYEFNTTTISMKSSIETEKISTCTISPNKLTVEVNIPDEGHYALKVFAKKEGDSDFINVINYMLIFDQKNAEKYDKRMMRERLSKATENGTEQDVEEALKNFEFYRVPDQGEIQKAKQKLKYFEAKRELTDAMQRRNVKVLEAAIENAKNSFNVDKMRINIKKAEGLLSRLKKLEGFIHPITKIERDTLLEVRRYTNPRPAIRDVLTATYILLGHDIESVQKWEYLKSQLTKSGRESLQSLVLHCDPESVSQATAELADHFLKPLDLKAVREASNETAALYQWAAHVTEVRLKETEKEPEKQHSEPKCESMENISEAEAKLNPRRSSIKSGTSSLRSVQPKVDSIRKKGDKAMIPKKFNRQTEAVRSSFDRFLWPKR